MTRCTVEGCKAYVSRVEDHDWLKAHLKAAHKDKIAFYGGSDTRIVVTVRVVSPDVPEKNFSIDLSVSPALLRDPLSARVVADSIADKLISPLSESPGFISYKEAVEISGGSYAKSKKTYSDLARIVEIWDELKRKKEKTEAPIGVTYDE